jgi:hypothetical protein
LQPHQNTQIYLVHPTWATSTMSCFLYDSLISFLELRTALTKYVRVISSKPAYLFHCSASLVLSHTTYFFLRSTSLPKSIHNLHVTSHTHTSHFTPLPFLTYVYISIGIGPLQKWTKCPPKPITKVDKIFQNPTIYNCFPPSVSCSIAHTFIMLLGICSITHPDPSSDFLFPFDFLGGADPKSYPKCLSNMPPILTYSSS